jgi:hypothetical protein
MHPVLGARQALVASMFGLFAGGGSLGAPPPAEFPASVEGLHVPPRAELSSDPTGRMALWDRDDGRLAVWSSEGKLEATCDLGALSLPSEPQRLAVSGDLALLAFLDPVAGNETARQAVVVNLDTCEVASRLQLPGLAVVLVGTDGGWTAAVNRDELATTATDIVATDGRQTAELGGLEEPLKRLMRELGGASVPGQRLFRIVGVRKEVWALPWADYELWRLAQRGRPFHSVAPPPCLRAEGRTLTGDENAAHVAALARGWPKQVHDLAVAAPATKGLKPSYLAATAGVVTRDWYAAVTVRDPRFHSGQRVDFWDLLREVPVAVIDLPRGTRVVALGETDLIVDDDAGVMEGIELPDLSAEVDPCEALTDALAADAKAGHETPGATRAVQPTAQEPGAGLRRR